MFPLNVGQLRLRDRVRHFVESELRPMAGDVAANDAFSTQIFDMFKQIGLFQLVLPQKYGGIGAGVLDLSLVTTEIARASTASALMYFPTQAVMSIVLQTGTEKQLARWLPEFGRGDKLAAFCLTEPNYGSDASSLMTKAERDHNAYVLNGTKSFITLGEHADYYLVFARTGPGKRAAGISTFLIDQDTPGLSFGRQEHKMGLEGSVTQEVIMTDCRIPAFNRLLDEGHGWRVLTEAANPMRLWGAGSMSLGMAQEGFQLARDYTRDRLSSGKATASHQAVQFMLADMATRIESVRSLLQLTAARLDRAELTGPQAEKCISMCKCLASDVAMDVCTDAVQILGRAGVSKDNPVERLFRDAKAVQIFDGSNQIQRMIIARHLLMD